jgi:hypothetical protein
LAGGWRELVEFVSRSWVELLQDSHHWSRSFSYIGKTKYVTEHRDLGSIFRGYFVWVLALKTGCGDSTKLMLWVFETNAKTVVFGVCYPLTFMLYNFSAFVTVSLSQNIVGKCSLFAVYYKITSTIKLHVLCQNFCVLFFSITLNTT